MACCVLAAQQDSGILAIVKSPIVDVAGKPLSRQTGSLKSHYKNFPFAPDKGHGSCSRVHQLKYNEIVTIVSDPLADEVKCVASNFYYLDKHNKRKSSFWMLRRDLIPLSTLSKKIDITHIPPPISQQQSPREYNKNVLTLIQPWWHKKAKKRYSMGTRFMRCPACDTPETYAVYWIDHDKGTEDIVQISKERALVSYPSSKEKRVALFLRLLRRLARPSQGSIPYVYGGSSYIKKYPERGFALLKGRVNSHPVTFWQRAGTFEKPLSGFDCSSLILCAAQIAGIPYYCKNTHALADLLKPLAGGETLEEGDLLWYDHHVMVVSDVKKNLFIEAVGYDSGYGKVHEVEVKKIFRGIKDYKGLIKAHHTKHALMRLNSKGKPYKPIHRLKILKLKSLWEQR
jgi:hypothetical protein